MDGAFQLWRRWLAFFAGEARHAFSRQRPFLEVLEDRSLLSAYLVTTTADSGTGSLRDAINQVNAGSYNEIDFNIGASGSAQQIIPLSALPAITASGVYINGLSQGGNQLITLYGHQANGTDLSGDGLLLSGSNCTVSGIGIERFGSNGIEIAGSNNTIGGSAATGDLFSGNGKDGILIDNTASGVQVQGNLIGLGYSANNAVANSSSGIEVGGSNNTIGGTTSSARNIISGNAVDGIQIDSGASGVQVQGNYLGTNAAGTAALGNSFGAEVFGSDDTIGGTAAGARNILSGNSADGIYIDAPDVQFEGNYVGVNAAGTSALANSAYGITVQGDNDTIGGLVAGARNVISGNIDAGVQLNTLATGILVAGNYIGTDVTGASAIANYNGINILDNNNTIGGTTSGSRNVISGNLVYGINLGEIRTATSGVVIEGNYIGTDSTGNVAVPNSIGVMISDGVNNTMGSSVWAARNVISGNTNDGVLFTNGGSENHMLGNIVGANADNTAALANSNGIEIQNSNNTIGGTAAGDRNIIAGNLNDGVLFDGQGSGNIVQGNFIGLGSGGNALGNANGLVDQVGGNVIGGTFSGARNCISANIKDGLLLESTINGSVVEGNFIGTNAGGTGALGNSVGVEMNGWRNTIGSTIWFARNVISGNSSDGVLMDSSAVGNVVQGNIIGVNANNSASVPNSNGIEIAGTANTIGGPQTGQRNIISGNKNDGVVIDSSASENGIVNNLIGLTSGGSALGNGGYGVSIAGNDTHEVGNTVTDNAAGGVFISAGSSNLNQDALYGNGPAQQGPGIILGAGANNNLTAPVINSVTTNGTILTVTGVFTAPMANVTYWLYFFVNPSGDAEGKVYIGRLSVKPSSSGTQSFSFATTTSATTSDPLLTVTLTDNLDDTSEFSSGVMAS